VNITSGSGLKGAPEAGVTTIRQSHFRFLIFQSEIYNLRSSIRVPMILIGTSGYNYPHWWNDVFYPSRLPQRKWLEFYAQYFDTVELNVSFYRLPKKEVFDSWYKRTPKRFSFAVKGSRFITHIRRLKDCREPYPFFLTMPHL